MKKTLLCALFASLALFIVAGCDHKKNDGGPSINKDDLFSLKGNYEIEAAMISPRLVDQSQTPVDFAKNCELFLSLEIGGNCSVVKPVEFAGLASFDGANADSMVFQTKGQMWGGEMGQGITIMENNNKMVGLDLYLKYNYIKTLPLTKALFENAPGIAQIAIFSSNSGREFDKALTGRTAYSGIILLLQGSRLYLSYSSQVPLLVDGVALERESTVSFILKKVSDTPVTVDSNVLLDPATTPGYDGAGFKTNEEIGYNPDAAL